MNWSLILADYIESQLQDCLGVFCIAAKVTMKLVKDIICIVRSFLDLFMMYSIHHIDGLYGT